MKILILEDDSYRVNFFLEKFSDDELIITENSYVAVDYLEKEVFNHIFLDHDLGDGNGCGLDVANYLYNNPLNKNNKANIIIHSWNVPAAESMVQKLIQANHIPFDVAVFSTF